MQLTPSFTDEPRATLYELMGGAETIARLVNVFYDKIPGDPDLAPIFPDDLTETRQKQYCFLTQFFGGPPLYRERYGHPRLRARHLPFPITPRRARAWLAAMSASMDEIGVEPGLKAVLMERLINTALHMVNTPDDADQGTGAER